MSTRPIASNLGLAVILAMLALFALDRCDAFGVREWAYLRANDVYLGQIEMPPGAVEVSRESTPYSLADSGFIYVRPDGWSTRIVVAVPSAMSEPELRGFYEPQLASSWRRSDLVVGSAGVALDQDGKPVSTDPASLVITSYCRDGGTLSFDYEWLRQDGTYAITADHARSVC